MNWLLALFYAIDPRDCLRVCLILRASALAGRKRAASPRQEDVDVATAPSTSCERRRRVYANGMGIRHTLTV